MRIERFVITSLMLNLLASPVFSQDTAQPANIDFKPIDSLSYVTNQTPSATYKNATVQTQDMKQVMFYIPVYTMTVQEQKEPVIMPAAVHSGGPNVIMPVYNHINREKSVINPISPAKNNNDKGSSISDENTDAGKVPGTESPPHISGNTENMIPKNIIEPSNSKKSKTIVAAAPIIAVPTAVFKRGTKVRVVACDELNSQERKYKRMEFVTIEPVVTTYSTIPIGTKIKGEVVKIKEPQYFGNGALVSLKANKLVYEDGIREVSGVVTRTNEKKVFFNKVKGERTYLKEMAKYTQSGKDYYRKMALKSHDYAASPKTILISPFPVLAGVVGIGAHAMISPFHSFKVKGEEIKLASGSEYELKLTSDCKLPINRGKSQS